MTIIEKSICVFFLKFPFWRCRKTKFGRFEDLLFKSITFIYPLTNKWHRFGIISIFWQTIGCENIKIKLLQCNATIILLKEWVITD